jgi:cation transport ATPase
MELRKQPEGNIHGSEKRMEIPHQNARKILQFTGIVAILFGGFLVSYVCVSAYKTYRTEQVGMNIIGFVLLAGVAVIPCYIGWQVFSVFSVHSLQRLYAMFLITCCVIGARLSFPLNALFPSISEHIWHESVLLLYAIAGSLLYYTLRPRLITWAGRGDQLANTRTTTLFLWGVAFLCAVLITDLFTISGVLGEGWLFSDVRILLTGMFYGLGRLCVWLYRCSMNTIQ